MRPHRSLYAPALALAAGLIPCVARAAVPRIVGTPLVENPAFDGTPNTMMYDVTVTVDGIGSDPQHVAVVGYVADDDYTTCSGTTAWKWSHSERFDTADTRTWTLYNFQPGTTYRYKVTVGKGPTARSRCGILETAAAPTPTVPADLGYLNFSFAKNGPYQTRYVLVETDDCGGSGTSTAGATDYLVVLDVDHESIVWYLDIAAAAGLRNASASGFRYQPGPTLTSGRIMTTVSKQYVFEWGFDGRAVHSYDMETLGACDGDSGSFGPCLHHDVFKSDDTGNTYAMTTVLGTITSADTEWEESCGTETPFINDGYTVLDSSFALSSERYLSTDYGYDPAVDGGPNATKLASRPHGCEGDTWANLFDSPNGVIDWTHANAIAASKFGATEMIDMSVKEFDQIVRFNAATGAVVWKLSGHEDYSDWGTIMTAPGVVGSATFADQHDVHATAANTLFMLDNQGDSGGARALQIHLDAHPPSATIEKTWAMVNALGNPLACELEGSAEKVPGSTDDHVFVLCANLRIASELTDPTGNTGTVPPLVISLPDGTRDAFCTSGGPDDRSVLRGWHRAFPLARVGEF